MPGAVHSKDEVEDGSLCPLQFAVIPMQKPRGILSNPSEPEVVIGASMQPCAGVKCKLWDQERGNCGLVTPKLVLEEILEALAPLKRFGG